MNTKHSMFRIFDEQEINDIRKERNTKLQTCIRRLCEARIKELNDLPETSMEHPNWAILRAYRDGRVRELKEMLKVFDDPTTE